jgi:DNA-directed RNA polymerase subunit beta'
LKDNEDIVEPLSERILGRVTVHDIYDPISEELICAANEEITDEIAKKIEESSIEEVEIRSVLTCETKLVHVQNAMAVTWQPVKWYRQVKR